MAPVSKGRKKRLWAAIPPKARLHLWRTVGPNIPCQVASQQSLTPFLRADPAYLKIQRMVGVEQKKPTAWSRSERSIEESLGAGALEGVMG
jgi:hypothetical protein